MKIVNTPKQRVFFRHTALHFLAIRQYACENLPCLAKKSLAVGHIANYQTSPSYGSTKFALVRPLTHNLTHTGKEADGDSGADRTESIIFLEQKGPETAEYQRFLVFQAVGKDEVSNSKNPLKSVDFGGFFVVLGTFLAGLSLRVFADPHRDPQ